MNAHGGIDLSVVAASQRDVRQDELHATIRTAGIVGADTKGLLKLTDIGILIQCYRVIRAAFEGFLGAAALGVGELFRTCCAVVWI